MLMQNFGVTKKEHYGMLSYFLEWSIAGRISAPVSVSFLKRRLDKNVTPRMTGATCEISTGINIPSYPETIKEPR